VTDAIVVGAGVVGAACAVALARDGRRVLVLDALFAAGGTTAAGMGHLVVMDDSPEQLALTGYSCRLWRALAASLPRTAEYERCGTIWVAEDEAQLAAVHEKQRVYAAAGIASEVLDPRALAAAEPFLRGGLAGGLLVPDDAVVYQPQATVHFLREARALGAELREGETWRVESVVPNGVRLASGETLHADVVVNAAGAEAARLTPELPVVPRKGHLVITDRHPEFVSHQLVELGYLASAHRMTSESVAFNLQPRATGQVLIGSSRELVGWDASINPRIVRRMLERARQFMPALADASVLRTWTGFRPATPDKLPLIGAWERVPGLWIAAGHEGLGITTASGTAQLLADLVAGREPAIDAAPYAPSRVLAEHADDAAHAEATP
jgi:glycine/D-amino acid oxidase-like deaminating enzyme